MKRLPLAADFILFVAFCVSAAYWGLQLFKPQVRPVAAPLQAAPVALNLEAAAGLFGGRSAGEVVASIFQLKGVIAAGPDSVAILVADGKPPQAVGVNMEVASGVTVKEVYRQYVLLNAGGTVKRVDLPEIAKAGLELDGSSAAGPSGTPILGGSTPAGPSGAPMAASAMNANNDQMPSQQPSVRRPSGIGPAAFGAMPTPMPSPKPQPVGLNVASMRNPMLARAVPGLQK